MSCTVGGFTLELRIDAAPVPSALVSLDTHPNWYVPVMNALLSAGVRASVGFERLPFATEMGCKFSKMYFC